jgi:hypothetical protein
LKWEEPHGGNGTDEFVLAPQGTALAAARALDGGAKAVAAPAQDMELHVYSTINSAGQTLTYRTVYQRKH